MPRTFAEDEVELQIRTAHVTTATAGCLKSAIKESQNLLYITKNLLVHGDCAHEGYWYTWRDVYWSESGVEFDPVAVKNNKKQVDRPKKGIKRRRAALTFTEDDMLDPKEFCIATMLGGSPVRLGEGAAWCGCGSRHPCDLQK